MAQNEMKAMRDMPWRVRSTEGLGAIFTQPTNVERAACSLSSPQPQVFQGLALESPQAPSGELEGAMRERTRTERFRMKHLLPLHQPPAHQL